MEVDEMLITAIKEREIQININYKRGLVEWTIQNNLLEKIRVKIAEKWRRKAAREIKTRIKMAKHSRH